MLSTDRDNACYQSSDSRAVCYVAEVIVNAPFVTWSLQHCFLLLLWLQCLGWSLGSDGSASKGLSTMEGVTEGCSMGCELPTHVPLPRSPAERFLPDRDFLISSPMVVSQSKLSLLWRVGSGDSWKHQALEVSIGKPGSLLHQSSFSEACSKQPHYRLQMKSCLSCLQGHP